MTPTDLVLAGLFLVAAVLYSSVGHAGASGYLAAMALLGVAPADMKPIALALNVLVAGIATARFARAGHFSWSLFWPFAVTSIPLAYLGGRLALPGHFYKPLVGVVLLYSAVRLAWAAERHEGEATRPLALPLALFAGAVIGLLSGLTGVGGGIFLSPLILLARWSDPKRAAGVAAPFILVNSAAGLAGNASGLAALPAAFPLWAVAVGVGGWVGATHGSRRLAGTGIRRMLAAVLVIAGLKLVLS